jgi:hypothetical protein
MKQEQSCVNCGVGTTTVLLSPVALIGTLLVASINGGDFCHSTCEIPIALGLCAPGICLTLRWLVRRLSARLGASFGSGFASGHTAR